MAHRKLDDLQVRGRVVFCRVDFNVPLDGATITDDRRIRAALPTIEWLRDEGARVVCASHLGRPDGSVKPEFSLAPVAERLRSLVSQPVPMARDCVGEPAAKLRATLKNGEIGLLENLRFHAGETAGDESFSERLAEGIDVYVNDAFGAAHRAHASVVGVPRFVDDAAPGRLMNKEIEALSRLRDDPPRPYVAILGGAKVSDKILLVEKLLERVNVILIGGAMAYTFLRARGIDVGSSRVEEEMVDLAGKILTNAEAAGVDVHLPQDHTTASGFDGRSASDLSTTDAVAIESGRMGLDIGPKTLAQWKGVLDEKIATVLWNGPVGLFEAAGCEAGTRGLAQHLAGLSAFRVLGGGDTAAAAAQFGLENEYDHVSTGGGAALEFLSCVDLPGVVALQSS